MRTKEEINTEYAKVAAYLGDLQAKYEIEKEKILTKISELSKEMEETDKVATDEN